MVLILAAQPALPWLAVQHLQAQVQFMCLLLRTLGDLQTKTFNRRTLLCLRGERAPQVHLQEGVGRIHCSPGRSLPDQAARAQRNSRPHSGLCAHVVRPIPGYCTRIRVLYSSHTRLHPDPRCSIGANPQELHSSDSFSSQTRQASRSHPNPPRQHPHEPTLSRDTQGALRQF